MRPWHALACAMALALTGWAGVALSGPQVMGVAVRDVEYSPSVLRVRVGEAVEWANEDPVAHTATASDGSWDLDVPPGGSGRLVMRRAGTFAYFCRYHPTMTGQIAVAP